MAWGMAREKENETGRLAKYSDNRRGLLPFFFFVFRRTRRQSQTHVTTTSINQ